MDAFARRNEFVDFSCVEIFPLVSDATSQSFSKQQELR